MVEVCAFETTYESFQHRSISYIHVQIQHRSVQPVELLPGTQLPEMQPYVLNITTGDSKGAGTDANVTVTLLGSTGQKFGPHLLQAAPKDFERGQTDVFELNPERGMHLGQLEALHVEHDNTGRNPDWLLSKITVQHAGEPDIEFVCDEWIAPPQLQRRLQRKLFAATSSEKKAYKVSVYTGGL